MMYIIGRYEVGLLLLFHLMRARLPSCVAYILDIIHCTEIKNRNFFLNQILLI